jgi:endonuclease YncB( thermonuclease family)
VFHHFVGLLASLFLFTTGAALAGDTAEPKRVAKFVRFTGCEFLDTAYADGDSFRVRVDGHERVLRLYFVDTPESDTRFPLRNAQQAEYFGITPEQSVEAGKAAKRFVHDLLSGKKLTVYTHWGLVIGSRRYYAVVEVDGRNLADVLVEAGLARLKGFTANQPDGTKIDDYWDHLRELETIARAAKLGAWEHSVPAKAQPVIEEVREVAEIPRWAERSGFAGIGAGGVGLLWAFSRWRGGRKGGVSAPIA